MEHLGLTPHLQRVIKSYQTTAMRSLHGPGTGVFPLLSPTDLPDMEEYRKAFAKKLPTSDKSLDFVTESIRVVPPPFPIQQTPVFATVDTPSKSEKITTNLEGEPIACFVVGGEKRLCLPQILNTVLRNFTLQQINLVCDELHIFCSRCNSEQLNTLKVTGILPLSAPSCGLITKTDAERLCHALLYGSPEKSSEPPTPESFKVYHECFGKCKGIFNPELYSSPNAKCIQCFDCMGTFSPQTFVCHSHKALENRTCHWGFDSANWRSYLLLAKDQDGTKLQEVLEDIKAKFEKDKKLKRKQNSCENDLAEFKRSKSEDMGASGHHLSTSSGVSLSWPDQGGAYRGMSAFRPWSPDMIQALKEGKLLPAPPSVMRDGFSGIPPPFLQTGPPVLLHPERVIPLSESSRYERGFAPNVSLAPASQQKLDVDDVSDDEDKVEVKKSPVVKQEPKPLERKSLAAPAASEYKEWDVPSESDESSHPSDGEDGKNKPDLSMYWSKELCMVKEALDGKVGKSPKQQESFLTEFTKVQQDKEEQIRDIMKSNKLLKQKFTSFKLSSKQSMKRLQERNEALEKEVAQIKALSQAQLLGMHADAEKLLKEFKRTQSADDSEASRCSQLNRELTAKLQHYDIAVRQLRCDNFIMQEELQRLGIHTSEIFSKKFNGRYTPSHASPSPQSSPNARSRSQSMSSHYSASSIKRERDT